MTNVAVRVRSPWRSLLTLVVCLSVLTCTGAGSPGSEAGENSAKVEAIRNLEQKTLSLAPPLVQATVGLSIMGGMGAGSGVIVSEDGLILTAGHVVPPPGQELIVQFSDGKTVKAKALGADKAVDAGLAQITEKGKYPFVKMGKSANLKKGDWVLAIGNPGGYRADRKPPIRLGRVLTLPNKDAGNVALWIGTDATVAPGDSGGPLFNMDGEVVGIHSNISPQVTENRHVAIDDFTKRWDFMMAGNVTGKMFNNGNGSRPQLGVTPVEANGKVRVSEIVKDSPAEKAGLKVGDIFRSINGTDIEKAEDLYKLVRKAKSGKQFDILILRDGEEKEFTAKLGEGPRTFENPYEELEQFLKQYGYKRPDGIWEYQPTPENKPAYDKVVAKHNELRNKVVMSGELRVKEEDKKNAPKTLEALSSLSVPVSKSLVLIYNGSEKSEGDFDEKPSVLGTIISSDGYILTKASEL